MLASGSREVEEGLGYFSHDLLNPRDIRCRFDGRQKALVPKNPGKGCGVPKMRFRVLQHSIA